MGKYRYPRQVKAIKETVYEKKNGENIEVRKTLSVENYMSAVNEREDEDGYMQDPTEIFAPYARFRFTIIKKNCYKKDYVYGNIKKTALATLEARTMVATSMILTEKMKANIKTETTCSKAESVTIKVGKDRGKTPYQILNEKGVEEGAKSLYGTMQWLKEKNDTKNNEQIDAIQQALQQVKDGKTDFRNTENPQNAVIDIYSIDYATIASTKREKDKKQLFYSLQIQCVPSYKMPYRIVIRNYWANVGKDGLGCEPETIEDDVTLFIQLTEEDWLDTLASMIDIKNIYLNTCGPACVNKGLHAGY